MPLAYGSQIIWLDGYSPITNKKRQPEDRLIKVNRSWIRNLIPAR